MKKRYFSCIIILMLFLITFLPLNSLKAQAESDVTIKRVLVLYYDNNGSTTPWVNSFDEGLHSALADRVLQKGLELDTQYTDLLRNTSQVYLDQLINLIKLKYETQTPDIIVVNMNPYSEFLERICNNLFPKTKIVFSVYGSSFMEILANYPGKSTAVYTEMGHIESCGLIERVLPHTKNIFVVCGATELEDREINRIKDIFDKNSDRFKFSYLKGLSIDELLARVGSMPENSAIYFTTYMMDPAGKSCFSSNVLSLISKQANSPIFSFNNTYMGEGLVGGKLVSPEKMGQTAGELVKRILDGEDASSIKPIEVSGVNMFDWRQLKKWGISEKLLPEGSIIKYREYTFFEKYRWRIIFWLGLVILQAGLIAYLITSLSRRRRAEYALFNSERKYRRLIESTRDAIISIDITGVVQTCNLGAMEIFGYREDEIAGRSLLILAPEEERERQAENIKGVMEADSFMAYESVMVKKSGAHIPVKISMSTMKNESEEIIGLIQIIRDISDQKLAEEERKKLEAALRQSQKMEAIGTLAGGIAHDFNNILTAVLGYTELALFGIKKGISEESSLHSVLKAGRRAKDLVNQILTYARKTHEEVAPLLIGPIADDVLKLLRSTIPSSIAIKKTIETDSVIMADRTRVHQVFLNICTNAVQAMSRGGGTLTVNITDIGIERENGLKPGDYIKISIADTGIGIPEENLALIFDPYFTTKVTGEGTGLGLSVVHGIVERYGGKIIVESELNRGTVFTIYLPVAKVHASIEQHKYEDLPSGSERILFVDDEPAIIEVTSRLLESLGYKVTSNNDSTEALALFRKTPEEFDLLITDMTMPGMNGDILAAEVMKIRNDMPVILCTGYSKTISEEIAMGTGLKAFLSKPIEFSVLAGAVRKVLDEFGNKALKICS